VASLTFNKPGSDLLSLFFLCIFLFTGGILSSQPTFIISGRVLRCADSLPLIGASVYDNRSGRGSVTDTSGSYQLTLLRGQHKLAASYLGYRESDTVLPVSSNLTLDFYLAETTVTYQEVVVTADTRKDYVTSTQMGEIRLDNLEISRLPSLLGESDPIRLLQLTPGIQSGTEGGVGFYVRGGGVDQNLVMIDNAVIYNPGHLMGFLSVFNPDIIKEVSLIKSGIPARYGGRMSAVVNAETYKGSGDSLSIKGQVGFLTSRISVSRSVNKGKGSFYLSARQAYPDLVIEPVMAKVMRGSSALFTNSKYNFYDLGSGFSFRAGTKDYLTFTGHYGQDKFRMENTTIHSRNSLDWGNTVASLRWNHVFNTTLSLSNSLSFTRYDFDLSGSQSEYSFGMFSSVEDYTYRTQLSHYRETHKFSAGGDLTWHAFIPNEFDVHAGSFIADFVEFNKLFAWEGGIYAEDDIVLSSRWSLGTGLRYSFFNQVGPYTEYLKDKTSLITDSIVYPPGQSLAFYHNLEPRLSLKYQPGSKSSLKASFMHIAQYMHLATSSSVSLPMDIWLPSSKIVRPQIGDQVSLGYFRKLSGEDYETSVEIYYKNVRQQLEFVSGIINNSIGMTLEESIEVGQGRAYGAEFFIRKKTGQTTGWAGYTISRTEKQFDRINEGRIYPAKYDRRHDLSVSVIHTINEHWNASLVFIYVSGNALTIPVGRYIIQGNIVNEYGEVNSFRMPPYHRLDLSVTRERTTGKGNYSAWIFSVYNVYNRANPFYIYFETTGDLQKYQLEVKARMVSLFPVIPSLSWRFKF
jgi:hypothetical protein